MKPGVSHSDTIGNVEGVAELQEARGLVAGRRIDRAAEMLWIVGDQAERLSLDADEGGDHADAEIAADFQHRALVGEEIDHGADVVDPQAVFRDRPPQQPLVRRLPVGDRALEIRQIFLRRGRRFRLVLDQDVDDAVRRLERHRAYFRRMIDAEAAALDHRGPPMPIEAFFVAMMTSQQPSIAALPAKQ
jgi:hypothetical protein